LAAADGSFARLRSALDEMRQALRHADLAGWLLYDLKGRNPVAGALLGQGVLSRRWFVLVPSDGEPVALVHSIEQAPWQEWPWRKHVYSEWQSLEALLGEILPRGGTVAMEYTERDAVPVLDLVPAGVVELVRAHGVAVASSGELVSRFHSRWSAAGLASHRRTAALLADVAAGTFDWLAAGVQRGETISETAMHERVLVELSRRGAGVGADCIAATGRNAADPHYHPAGEGSTFARGDVVLLDLWAKEADDAIYADQTWMGFLGPRVPQRAASLFATIRDARDAAVSFLEDAWRDGRAVSGGEVDDVARGVVREHGHAQHFVHRTGHSIDESTHGVGPNIDNFETRERRTLIEGVGFSIEPGIYIPGEIGLRTEINVYMSATGPEVTTPRVQSGIATLAVDA
jgi:Xaa-Pro dipeptidase